MEQQWTVTVWDGYSTRSYNINGTYGQVSNICHSYPPGYIWSIT